MPTPVRQHKSGALIFIPSAEEVLALESKRAYDRSKEELTKELEEVRMLKEELKSLVDKHK